MPSLPNAAAIVKAATILSERRRSGMQGNRLPESCRPVSTEVALAIQALVTTQLGESVNAWKCGTPSDSKLVIAPIYTSTIFYRSPCAVWGRAQQVRIEPELAFVLAHDLPLRNEPYMAAELDAAIGSVHLALELIDSRYSDPAKASFAENLADGLLNQGLYIGPEVDPVLACAANQMHIDIHSDGQLIHQFDGQHPNLNPRAPLHWLAEFLRGKGQALRAGQVIITGSYVASFEVPLDTDIHIRFGELGALQAHFTAR
ncbi:fumarylacetoacetate hydrolase family protein [Undibacterium sp. Jales W-56]|uniref:fumarylacetoacetate hydrolase family protein n=1 Tax=Undibacterium sp. Jales W-56 TaxID=2897325 RepID=UPI0021CE2737|nr:fumarylacetoacetate hydrolase family protein [Undibacterium sp. Jales W-56]MCU6435084.1 fumarylacetoacetate hydrolase family protein [Undibacterium sp. Jales W-56]